MAAADGTPEESTALPDAEPLYRFPDAGSDGSSSSDDGEAWSIPDAAVTFTRDGWERYCAAAGVKAREESEASQSRPESPPTAEEEVAEQPSAAHRPWRIPRVQAGDGATPPAPLDAAAIAARVAGLVLPAPPWAAELARVDALLLAGVAARKQQRHSASQALT